MARDPSATLTRDSSTPRRDGGAPPSSDTPVTLGLVIAWCREDVGRLGEVLLAPSGTPGGWVELGRGSAREADPPRVDPQRQRPGRNILARPLDSPYLSHQQLKLRAHGTRHLEVEQIGRCKLRHNGRLTRRARVVPGDTLELVGELLLVCAPRPERFPRPRAGLEVVHDFGEPDAAGFVGESPAAWRLRSEIAFVARGGAHALIRGPSGSGKELVARAIHGDSGGPLVARNAATLPPTLVDAELFGNARDYPNPGMAARPGLVGEADGGTLFLDEFAEMPHEVQTHLLRVLDAGEYQRLGEAAARRSRFRLVAATNRAPSALREDVLARMPLRIQVPGLEARREDIPLLVLHLMRRRVAENPSLAGPYFDGEQLRITPRLVSALLRRRWATHVRELDALLWQAMMVHEDTLDLAPDAREAAPPPVEAIEPAAPAVDPDTIPPAVIQACLDKHNGVQAQVWKALGLKSRFVLIRLIKKHNLTLTRRS